MLRLRIMEMGFEEPLGNVFTDKLPVLSHVLITMKNRPGFFMTSPFTMPWYWQVPAKNSNLNTYLKIACPV